MKWFSFDDMTTCYSSRVAAAVPKQIFLLLHLAFGVVPLLLLLSLSLVALVIVAVVKIFMVVVMVLVVVLVVVVLVALFGHTGH